MAPRAGGSFAVNDPNGGEFSLHGKPLHELADQGHGANGAAGTAFVVIGVGGCIAIFLRHHQLKPTGFVHGFTAFLYNFWLIMTVLSAIFSLASLIYVFTLTYQHDHQDINTSVASQLNNQPYSNQVPYPLLTWTPQNWFAAVLRLSLVHDNDRSDIQTYLRIMHGWQWNLVPMTVLGFVVMGLAMVDRMKQRQASIEADGASRLEAAQRQKAGSPFS
ncbi:hypothetical protein LTR37_021398 [Vermiconidia calcicola]|uniref:Uncharacterized protein n=1 Tax=Vermiconidia calcicola TaxID=1690605 RepID=A0ACC3M8V8_9PEZI|nr:hypothetical protein LTR37_021398 [Vermiconidia calcicola]